MTEYQEQIQRIKDKLLDAKKADKNLEVFGATSHKYNINQPATPNEVLEFEQKYSIKLPECYKSFILYIGNGGAGPFYGIYPLGENVDDLIYDNTEKYLKNECILYPKMTNEYWKDLTKRIDDDDISDQDYEKEVGKLFAGILPIGSQGCTLIHGMVLNGQYKGRVVNLDMDRQKPFFTFENNFLNWYERWLDEIISGDLIKDDPSWFGYTKGGSEEELLTFFISSNNLEDKNDCLRGLLNKNALEDKTLNQIENLINEHLEHKITLIQILCKSNYAKAKPYLLELVTSDLRSVLQCIYWYTKDKSNEWLSIIKENIDRVQDDETFRFCTYILEKTNSDYGRLIVQFTKSDNENIRVQAYYSLGKLKNNKEFLDTFIEGLNDKSNRVIHSTLQALSGIKDERLLAHYKNLAERFPVEQNYILTNLNHRLTEYGLTNKTILNKSSDADTNSTRNNVKKKWYEIWK